MTIVRYLVGEMDGDDWPREAFMSPITEPISCQSCNQERERQNAGQRATLANSGKLFREQYFTAIRLLYIY
jgi:hypothetical protein